MYRNAIFKKRIYSKLQKTHYMFYIIAIVACFIVAAHVIISSGQIPLILYKKKCMYQDPYVEPRAISPLHRLHTACCLRCIWRLMVIMMCSRICLTKTTRASCRQLPRFSKRLVVWCCCTVI